MSLECCTLEMRLLMLLLLRFLVGFDEGISRRLCRLLRFCLFQGHSGGPVFCVFLLLSSMEGNCSTLPFVFRSRKGCCGLPNASLNVAPPVVDPSWNSVKVVCPVSWNLSLALSICFLIMDSWRMSDTEGRLWGWVCNIRRHKSRISGRNRSGNLLSNCPARKYITYFV